MSMRSVPSTTVRLKGMLKRSNGMLKRLLTHDPPTPLDIPHYHIRT